MMFIEADGPFVVHPLRASDFVQLAFSFTEPVE
jgi:hypothetical protein